MSEISVTGIQNLVYDTLYNRVWERRTYTLDDRGNPQVHTEFTVTRLYDRNAQTVDHTEPGQRVDRRA